MKEIDRHYKTLGLDAGASLEEINQAYRDLAFIWHPDRIPADNPRLLEKAAAKLKELNFAREQLRQLPRRSPHVSSAAQREATPVYKERSPYSDRHPYPSSPYPRNSYYDASQSDRDRHNSQTQTHRHTHSPQTHRPFYRDLKEADLRGANLKEKDLSGRNISLADLSFADLSDSFLHKTILEQANLYRANLFRANLLEANLRGANLQEANLIAADLSGADLSGADLRGAKLVVGNRMMVKLTRAILTGTILPDGRVHE